MYANESPGRSCLASHSVHGTVRVQCGRRARRWSGGLTIHEEAGYGVDDLPSSAKAQSVLFIGFDAWADGSDFGVVDAQSVARFNHVTGGSNVLYMDGDVEFVKYGAEAPANS